MAAIGKKRYHEEEEDGDSKRAVCMTASELATEVKAVARWYIELLPDELLKDLVEFGRRARLDHELRVGRLYARAEVLEELAMVWSAPKNQRCEAARLCVEGAGGRLLLKNVPVLELQERRTADLKYERRVHRRFMRADHISSYTAAVQRRVYVRELSAAALVSYGPAADDGAGPPAPRRVHAAAKRAKQAPGAVGVPARGANAAAVSAPLRRATPQRHRGVLLSAAHGEARGAPADADATGKGARAGETSLVITSASNN